MEKGKLYDAIITEWNGETEEILAELTNDEEVTIYYYDGIAKEDGEPVAVFTKQLVTAAYFKANAKIVSNMVLQ